MTRPSPRKVGKARVASPDAMYLIAKYLLGTGKRPAREVLPRKAGARRGK